MQKNDPVTFALLRVGRREQETDAQPGDTEQGCQHPEPGNHLASQRVEALRTGVTEPVDQTMTHLCQLEEFELFQSHFQRRGGRPRGEKNAAERQCAEQ